MSWAEFRRRLGLFALYAAAYSAFYIFPNFFPTALPEYLPMSWIDRATPFLPWTFLIYLSDWIYMLGLGFFILKGDAFNGFVRQIFLALFLSGIFFLAFPTTYPRPEYPEGQNFLVSLCLHIVDVADKPTNCFPSMHVAMTGVGAWAVREMRLTARIGFWIWAFLICASTLTTKQHYFLDIVGGTMVVVIVAALDWVVFQRRLLRPLLGWARNA